LIFILPIPALKKGIEKQNQQKAVIFFQNIIQSIKKGPKKVPIIKRFKIMQLRFQAMELYLIA